MVDLGSFKRGRFDSTRRIEPKYSYLLTRTKVRFWSGWLFEYAWGFNGIDLKIRIYVEDGFISGNYPPFEQLRPLVTRTIKVPIKMK